MSVLFNSQENTRSSFQDETMGRRVGNLLGASLFLTPYLLRYKLIPGSEAIWALNPLAIFAIFWLLLYMLGHKYAISRTVSLVKLILVAACGVLLHVAGAPISVYIAEWAPLLILLVVVPETIFPSLFKGFLKSINFSVAVIAACAALDLVTGYAVSRTIGSFYGTEGLEWLTSSSRLISYMGHSLLTAEIALAYFALNIFASKAMDLDNNQILVTLIAVFIVVLTGSRSAAVVLLSMILISFSSTENIRYIVVIVFGMLLLYAFGIFDTLIDRVAMGIAAGDITSSRNTKLDEMTRAGIIRYDWFQGHPFETGYTSYVRASLVIALEYPLLRFAFMYGIAFSALLGIVLFILPVIYVFRKTGVVSALLLALYFFHVNTYSSICVAQDGMLRCVLITWMFLCASQFIDYKKRSELKGDE